jgi:hypothetical protein
MKEKINSLYSALQFRRINMKEKLYLFMISEAYDIILFLV